MDSENKIVTIEERLKLMRGERKEPLALKYNALEIPCRILNATEKARLIYQAKQSLKLPGNAEKGMNEAVEVMIKILASACTVDNVPYASEEFLRAVSEPELAILFDQYETVLNTINPEFQTLTIPQIAEILDNVKKKNATAKDYYTWQLAGIGRYFLEQILPMVKEPGA